MSVEERRTDLELYIDPDAHVLICRRAGRGPEVMTLRHGDSWQLLRNIFFYDGVLLIVTDRDKMEAIRGIGRKVDRFFCPTVRAA
jgi:hypothetical protein